MRPPRRFGRSLVPLLLPMGTALFAAGCGNGSPTGPVKEIAGLPRSLSVTESALVASGNDFAFRLLGRLYGAAPDSNLFAAPLSASMALGMTLNGAAGTTFDQMGATLGYGNLTQDQINQGYRDLLDLLVKLDPKVQLAIGNSIWYRKGLPVRSDFLERTRSFFSARVEELDFSAPGAAGTINGWVKEQTRGKIPEIVDSPIDPLTVMFLINAVYFKGDWTQRFPKDKTANASFTTRAGAQRTVPLMRVEDTLLYAQNDLYQVVDLPYGGKAFSMTLLLPREGRDVIEVVASMSASSWAQMVAGLQRKEGTVFLPRFKLEWGKLLNETLKGMGMVNAFHPGLADFTRISDQALLLQMYVSKVKQKTYVDVNEEGTEAAGVTSVEIGVTSVPDRFLFRADRPFVFVIRERFSQTILFAGVFVAPPQA